MADEESPKEGKQVGYGPIKKDLQMDLQVQINALEDKLEAKLQDRQKERHESFQKNVNEKFKIYASIILLIVGALVGGAYIKSIGAAEMAVKELVKDDTIAKAKVNAKKIEDILDGLSNNYEPLLKVLKEDPRFRGEKGDQGHPGDIGPAGISNLELDGYDEKVWQMGVGGADTAEKSCPEELTVIGGGFSSDSGVRILESRPGSKNSWRVHAVNENLAVRRTVRAHVICAKIDKE